MSSLPRLSAPITERSSLLPRLSSSYNSNAYNFLHNDDDDDCRSIAEVIEDQHNGSFPIVSIGGSGAEIIPATSNTPDSHGDFKLPEDESLRVQPDTSDDTEGGKSIYLGGVTQRQFRVIFAGTTPPPPAALQLLTSPQRS